MFSPPTEYTKRPDSFIWEKKQACLTCFLPSFFLLGRSFNLEGADFHSPFGNSTLLEWGGLPQTIGQMSLHSSISQLIWQIALKSHPPDATNNKWIF